MQESGKEQRGRGSERARKRGEGPGPVSEPRRRGQFPSSLNRFVTNSRRLVMRIKSLMNARENKS